MSRAHRPRPTRPRARREREPGYFVDVWRSVAVLITDDPPLPEESRRLLAYSLIEIFTRDAPTWLPKWGQHNDPDGFVASLRELYAAGFVGIEGDRAFLGWPETDALGRKTCRRLPPDEVASIVQQVAEGPPPGWPDA